MIEALPQQPSFTSDELSLVTEARGRALSGVLSSFSKRRGRPLVIKAGTVDTDRHGRPFNRPKQLWRLNPQVKPEELQKIHEHLAVLVQEAHVSQSPEPAGTWHSYSFWSGEYATVSLQASTASVSPHNVYGSSTAH